MKLLKEKKVKIVKMSQRNNRSSGVGFFGLLTIVFITLKLTGHIEWSWLWVISPLWIPLFWIVLIMSIVFIISIKNHSNEE